MKMSKIFEKGEFGQISTYIIKKRGDKENTKKF